MNNSAESVLIEAKLLLGFRNHTCIFAGQDEVSINFDDYPVISIGRGPENIVVIPDQEVSRSHASLSFDGDKLLLKDLKSSTAPLSMMARGFSGSAIVLRSGRTVF